MLRWQYAARARPGRRLLRTRAYMCVALDIDAGAVRARACEHSVAGRCRSRAGACNALTNILMYVIGQRIVASCCSRYARRNVYVDDAMIARIPYIIRRRARRTICKPAQRRRARGDA